MIIRSKLEFVDEIEEQNVLEEIACNEKESAVRIKALEKIKSEKFFFKVARKDESWKVRIKATQMIKNQKFLAEVAIKDEDLDVAGEAIKKITSDKLLSEIVLKSSNFLIRQNALNKITKDKELHNIVIRLLMNNTDNNIAIAALKMIKDKNLLEDIAEKFCDDDVVLKIISSQIDNKKYAHMLSIKYMTLSDAQNVFNLNEIDELAMFNLFDDVRIWAINHTNNISVIRNILFSKADVDVRIVAFKKLITLNPDDIYIQLERVALNDKNFEVRKEAIQFLTKEDLNTLKMVVLNEEENEKNRILALSKIKNKDTLKELYQSVNYWYIKMVILDILVYF